MKLAHFPSDSKVWVYQADRFLSETEKVWLQEQIDSFCDTWASHGSQLKAEGLIYNDFTIVLSVDTSQANSSGCSIDKSVHFIKQIGKELNVDFFNRLNVWLKKEGECIRVPFKDLKSQENSIYFDATVSTLSDFNSRYEIKVSQLAV